MGAMMALNLQGCDDSEESRFDGDRYKDLPRDEPDTPQSMPLSPLFQPV